MRRILAAIAFAIAFASAPAIAQHPICKTPSTTTVGTSAVPVPAVRLAGRSQVRICNSLENTGGPNIKCRSDGSDPEMGAGSPGDYLAKGDCQPYVTYALANQTITCISDTPATLVTAEECVGEPQFVIQPSRFGPVQFTPANDTAIQRVAFKGRVLYDSGTSCNSGSACDSGVLDLTGVREIEVHADNSGTAFRDLSFVTYLDDGTTQIDSVVLRRVPPTSTPTGGVPVGHVRGMVGPTPPGARVGSFILFDGTSAANTAFDTGLLYTEDVDSISVYVVASGAVAGGIALTAFAYDDAAAIVAAPVLTGSAGGSAGGSWAIGPGSWSTADNGAAKNYGGGWSPGIPRRMKFGVGQLGAGVTGRVVVSGRGQLPGTFSVQMALPTKGKLAFGAGSSANGRLTVIGR